MPGHPFKTPLSYIITQSVLDLCRGDIYIKAIGKCFSSLCPSAPFLFPPPLRLLLFFPWSLLGVVTQDLILVLKTKSNTISILTTMIWTCFPVRDGRFLWDLVDVIVSWTKEFFPYLGKLWDALWLFWMIHSPCIHNRKMIFFVLSIILPSICALRSQGCILHRTEKRLLVRLTACPFQNT